MKPEILTYPLGGMDNRSYLLADPESQEAAVIDPSFGAETIAVDASRRGFHIRAMLLTHAHFDHIAGVTALLASVSGEVPVALHPGDLGLYRQGGGGRDFGLPPVSGPDPQWLLADRQVLRIGKVEVHVLHTPGHTPGHVTFYLPTAGAACCGDLIFAGSVGRTDLPGGDFDQLLESIRQKILTLPSRTRLLCGHGPETTVAQEATTNPFLR